MKVIFLDVDGVLNTIFCKEKLDGFIFVMDEKLELLKELVERTGAKLILSSSWRMGWYYKDIKQNKSDPLKQRDIRHFLALQEKLKEYGLELYGRTPVSKTNNRGEEIHMWFKNWRGEAIESYVILDDLDGKELRPHSKYLLQTSIRNGLTKKHVEKAVKMLAEK